jgi:riboflavin transporter FmnP
MFAVRNLLLLLTLSRVGEAMRSVAVALAVNVAVGFVCSRSMHYAAAVLGLVAGAIALAFFAGRAVRRVLSRLDYYYYAAY